MIVTIPGVGDVEFPDTMSADEINVAAKRLYEQAQTPTGEIRAEPAYPLREILSQLIAGKPSGETKPFDIFAGLLGQAAPGLAAAGTVGIAKGGSTLARGLGLTGARDIKRLGPAIARESPSFAVPERGAAGLIRATRETGPKALSAEREQLERQFLEMVPQVPEAPELLRTIKSGGAGGFAGKTGAARGGASAAAARTERAEAAAEMRQLLAGNPTALQAFEAMQRRYSVGSQISRLFQPGAKDPFAGGRLRTRALQERVAQAPGRVPPDLARLIGRGQIGYVDPRIPPWLLRYGAGGAAIGGGGYGLSRLLGSGG